MSDDKGEDAEITNHSKSHVSGFTNDEALEMLFQNPIKHVFIRKNDQSNLSIQVEYIL